MQKLKIILGVTFDKNEMTAYPNNGITVQTRRENRCS